MSTLYQCDWCGDYFDDRAQVASVDITIGGVNETLHACAGCVPDWLRQHYPEDREPSHEGPELTTDGGRVLEEPPSCRYCDEPVRGDGLCAKHLREHRDDLVTDGGTRRLPDDPGEPFVKPDGGPDDDPSIREQINDAARSTTGRPVVDDATADEDARAPPPVTADLRAFADEVERVERRSDADDVRVRYDSGAADGVIELRYHRDIDRAGGEGA